MRAGLEVFRTRLFCLFKVQKLRSQKSSARLCKSWPRTFSVIWPSFRLMLHPQPQKRTSNFFEKLGKTSVTLNKLRKCISENFLPRILFARHVDWCPRCSSIFSLAWKKQYSLSLITSWQQKYLLKSSSKSIYFNLPWKKVRLLAKKEWWNLTTTLNQNSKLVFVCWPSLIEKRLFHFSFAFQQKTFFAKDSKKV